jgi:hypothetical protein
MSSVGNPMIGIPERHRQSRVAVTLPYLNYRVYHRDKLAALRAAGTKTFLND